MAALTVEGIVDSLLFNDTKCNIGTINKVRYLNMLKMKCISSRRNIGNYSLTYLFFLT